MRGLCICVNVCAMFALFLAFYICVGNENSTQIFALLLNFQMIYLSLSFEGNCLIFSIVSTAPIPHAPLVNCIGTIHISVYVNVCREWWCVMICWKCASTFTYRFQCFAIYQTAISGRWCQIFDLFFSFLPSIANIYSRILYGINTICVYIHICISFYVNISSLTRCKFTKFQLR